MYVFPPVDKATNDVIIIWEKIKYSSTSDKGGCFTNKKYDSYIYMPDLC